MLIMNWLVSKDDLIAHVKQTVRKEKKNHRYAEGRMAGLLHNSEHCRGKQRVKQHRWT